MEEEVLRHPLHSAAAIAVVALSLVACGGSATTSTPPPSGPYTIGVTTDLTGKLAAAGGLAQQAALVAWQKKVNDAGGIKGHKVDLVFLDDKEDAATATTDYVQLATQNSPSIIFCWVVCAAPSIQAQYKIPTFHNSAPSTNLKAAEPNYEYSEQVPLDQDGQAIVAMAKTLVQPGARMAIIGASGVPDCLTMAQNMEKFVTQSGFTLALPSVLAPPNSTDMTVQTNQVLAKKPDVILGACDGDGMMTLVQKAMTAAGAGNIPFVDYTGLSYNAHKALNNPNVYSLAFQSFGVPDGTKATDEFIAAIQASGTTISPSAASMNRGWLEGLIFQGVFTKCGYPCPATKAQAILSKFNLDTGGFAYSHVTYSTGNHVPFQDLTAVHWDAASSGLKVVKSGLPIG
jgi:ABC-type branched-subunit amino acid transport system substrate-binding protein